MSLDTEALINGQDGFYNGIEARKLFLNGVISRGTKYLCSFCSISLTPINVEKYEDEDFSQTPHFRSKSTEPHLPYCPNFDEFDLQSNDVIKKKRHYNDKIPKVLNLPNIDPKTLKIIESETSSRSINLNSIEDKKNIKKTGLQNTKPSQNKISHFVWNYKKICFENKSFEDAKKALKKEELTLGDKKINYDFYFKPFKYIDSSFCESEYKTPRIFLGKVGDNYIDFNDRYEINIYQESKKWRIVLYKDHLIKNTVIKNKKLYLMTFPRLDGETVVYSSIDRRYVDI